MAVTVWLGTRTETKVVLDKSKGPRLVCSSPSRRIWRIREKQRSSAALRSWGRLAGGRHLYDQRSAMCFSNRPGFRRRLQTKIFAVGVTPYQSAVKVQVAYNTAWVVWNAVDIIASVGAVSAGIAFVMTQDRRLLYLPVVLPIIANYAAKRREACLLEGVLTEVLDGSTAARAALAAAAAREAKFVEIAAAMQRAAAEASTSISASTSAASRLDSRLSTIETTFVSAGRGLQEASREVDGVAARLAKAGSAQAAELAAAVSPGDSFRAARSCGRSLCLH
eukprot:jgi/Botrbrau1/20896/Bobra.0135s0027.1